jgi:hypothetical protein
MSDRYDSSEFDVIEYYNDIGVPDADVRQNYYGMGGIPHLVWLGTINMVGAGTDVIDGAPYDVVVKAHLADATPVAIRLNSFDLVAGNVDFDVELEDDMAGTFMVRAFVVENDLFIGGDLLQDVLRDMIVETALTISSDGQVQNVVQSYAVDAGWTTANQRIIVIVQDESTKEVMQMANTLPASDFAFRYYSLGERVAIDSGTHEFGEFAVFNTGNLADTYELTLDTAGLPGDWSAYITDGVDNLPSFNVTLNPGERAIFNVAIMTGSSGGGGVLLNIHSQNNLRTDDRQLSYDVITADTEILLVDDDGAESFEADYYAPAMAGIGRSFAIWDRGSASLTGDILSNFDAVVWNVGFAFPTLDDSDRAALTTFTNGGGSLFISGQDVGWDHNDQGGAALTWYRNTLKANYVMDDTNNYTLDGVPGDPITDGMSITISGGDGANNQDYPDAITPYDASSHVILAYNTTYKGAVAADTGVYRVVYLGFGFEAINNAADRASLMESAIDWLLPDLTGVPGDTAPLALRLDQNLPNPFNPKTMIRFALPNTGNARLDVFDVEGRRVRVLADGNHEAGEHELTWDGRDDAGRSLSSGVYFYRLQAEELNETRKMLLLK